MALTQEEMDKLEHLGFVVSRGPTNGTRDGVFVFDRKRGHYLQRRISSAVISHCWYSYDDIMAHLVTLKMQGK